MRWCKLLLSCWLILISFASQGQAFQPLPAERAFAFCLTMIDDHTVLAHWTIAPGYHLYRERFNFELVDSKETRLGNIVLPPGIPKEDEMLGKYQVYENAVSINVPFTQSKSASFTIKVSYQGCAEAGFCYAPVTQEMGFNELSEQARATQILASHNWLLTLLAFFGFGLLLAFTPCILPMIPILSGIILGEGKEITAWRGLGLSLIYVLAMATTYAAAGVFAGLAGSYVQAFLQNPWVLGTFSLFFILLALSLFGLYELRLPHRLHNIMTHLSNRQRAGTYIGVGIMGFLSALIISPCVTAPLIGALTYIGKTGDAYLGGTALFMMGLGMGVPLLVFGTLEGKFLPKAGPWMKWIKIFFGVLLLGVSISLLSRIISFDYFLPKINLIRQNSDFKIIKNINDLQHALADAKAQNKPVILDFYADWCITCKHMDRTTFNDTEVQQAFKKFILLRADVTANNAQDKALEKQLGVIAPPTIIFFNKEGVEMRAYRIVGEVDAEKLLKYLRKV